MDLARVRLDPVQQLRTDEPVPRIQAAMRLALWGLAAAVVVGWLALAALHVSDDYRITHLQGAWIAASVTAKQGQLYPPLFDGEHYAGTRWMPLPILLNALGYALIGDPLIAGKVVAALLMGILLVLVISVLRELSCPWPISAGLAAVIVATQTGLQAGTTIGGDLLPVVLQVGVLLVALHSRSWRAMAAAGALAGLGIASKLTALWALLAVMTWLAAQRKWRPAAVFASASVASAAIVLGSVELLTGGGLSRHLLAFWAAGIHGGYSVLRAPNQVLYNLLGFASATVVLLPLAVVGLLLSAGCRQLSVIHFALGYALLVLLAAYSDVGTGFNQLLDLVVLTTFAVGQFAGRSATVDVPMRQPVALTVIVVTVIWAAGLDLVRTVGFDLRRSVPAARTGAASTRAAWAVAQLVQPGEEVLAEDPSIYVALGRKPLILDPFMLTRLDRAHPDWIDPLIARILDRQFHLVVLVVALENRNVDYWWTDYHFGPRVASALRESYRPAGTIRGYHLYRPRPLTAPARLSPDSAGRFSHQESEQTTVTVMSDDGVPGR